MFWVILLIAIVAVVVVAGCFRFGRTNYRIGSGMFKSSEYNLDDQDNFDEKTYYDDDKELFK
ncbi:MAG: hypothetical protein UH734_07615 [Ruminococcus sp.]|nr:hypothetical protein [Ruminococcus sp.]